MRAWWWWTALIVIACAVAIWFKTWSLVALGVLALQLIIGWRLRQLDRPKPVDGETLRSTAERGEDAEVRGGQVLTHAGDRRASVEASLVSVQGGVRLPVFRVRIRLNTPIPFCFIVRRRQSPFAVDALVSNTPLDRPAFEYELKRIELDPGEAARYFEAAANLPRLMGQLLASGLSETIESANGEHDFRLEELTYDGSRLTALLQSAADPRDTPLTDAALERAQRFADVVDDFIRTEALEEAIRQP